MITKTIQISSNVSDVIQKVERLQEILKEANTLVDELASDGIKIEISI